MIIVSEFIAQKNISMYRLVKAMGLTPNRFFTLWKMRILAQRPVRKEDVAVLASALSELSGEQITPSDIATVPNDTFYLAH